MTFNCDLDLESAWLSYCITEVNILSKFNENPSRSTGDIERMRNQWLNPMTFNCDLDLEPWVLHIISLR